MFSNFELLWAFQAFRVFKLSELLECFKVFEYLNISSFLDFQNSQTFKFLRFSNFLTFARAYSLKCFKLFLVKIVKIIKNSQTNTIRRKNCQIKFTYFSPFRNQKKIRLILEVSITFVSNKEKPKNKTKEMRLPRIPAVNSPRKQSTTALGSIRVIFSC